MTFARCAVESYHHLILLVFVGISQLFTGSISEKLLANTIVHKVATTLLKLTHCAFLFESIHAVNLCLGLCEMVCYSVRSHCMIPLFPTPNAHAQHFERFSGDVVTCFTESNGLEFRGPKKMSFVEGRTKTSADPPLEPVPTIDETSAAVVSSGDAMAHGPAQESFPNTREKLAAKKQHLSYLDIGGACRHSQSFDSFPRN